jgi:hypothetical protein
MEIHNISLFEDVIEAAHTTVHKNNEHHIVENFFGPEGGNFPKQVTDL